MGKDRQIWIKIPADWLAREEIAGAGLLGRALYIAGQCHAATMMTDGRIARSIIPTLMGMAGIATETDTNVAIEQLLETGLWSQVGTYYQDTEYLTNNWSRAEYETFVAQRQTNGRKGGRPRKPPENHDGFSPPPDNHGGYENATTVVTQEPPRNHDHNHGANQDGTTVVISGDEKPTVNHRANQNETTTKPRSRDRSRDRDRPTEGEGDPDRDHAHGDRAHAYTREGNLPTPLRPGIAVDPDFSRRTFRAFVASYPKGVPASLQDVWGDLCPDQRTFDRIIEGLAAWRLSRQWLADGNDYVTKPLKFLQDRMYEDPPLAWRDPLPPDPVTTIAPIVPVVKADPADEAKRISRELNATTFDARYRIGGG